MAKKKDEKKNLPAELSEFERKQQEYKDLVNLCLDTIKQYKILFVSELVAFLPVSRATFYNYNLDKLDTIKEAIDNNKIMTKQGLRGKWYDGNNPVCQIALYKLICSEEERNAISNNPKPEKELGKDESLTLQDIANNKNAISSLLMGGDNAKLSD